MVDIHTQTFDLPTQWFPRSFDISVEADGRIYRFDSLVPALRSRPTDGVLDLEAVWVGTGSAADFRGRDVDGKAVFIHTLPAPGSMGHSAGDAWEGAIRRAFEGGAAAILVIYGISDNFTIWQSLGGGITIPGAFMGYRDGSVVKELIGAGHSVRVKTQVDIDYREGLQSASIFGTLPGMTDEEILILAHLDGYFQAALDNASGIAVMLALAEYFSDVPEEERRRNLVFVGTAGHHVGSPGSRHMHDKRETELADAVLMINSEHVSVKQTVYWGPEMRMTDIPSPRRWWVNGSEELVDVVLDAYQTFGVTVWDHMENRAARRDGGSGQGPAVDPDYSVAGDQAHRRRYARVDPRGRARGGRSRLREDHRPGKPTRSLRATEGGKVRRTGETTTIPPSPISRSTRQKT